MNIKQIFEAWIIANNPTEKQLELAEARAIICDNCPSKIVTFGIRIGLCGECGCPIRKKIFTNEYNPCPLLKWEETDKDYFDIKKTKTLL